MHALSTTLNIESMVTLNTLVNNVALLHTCQHVQPDKSTIRIILHIIVHLIMSLEVGSACGKYCKKTFLQILS